MRHSSYLLLGLILILFVSFLDFSLGHNAMAITPDQSQPKSLEKALQEAGLALDKKHFQECSDLLSPYVSQLTKDGILMLGKCQHESKNYNGALKLYSSGLSKNPNDIEFKGLVGLELFQLGRDAEALSSLKELIEKHKDYLPAYRTLAQIFEKKNNKYELRLLYQDMVERFGQKPEFVQQLCTLTTEDRLYDLSVKYCMQGTLLSPRVASNLVYLGITYNETGRAPEAEKTLRRASDSFSKSELAQLTMAKFFEEKKNFLEAFRYYKRAVEAEPQSTKALLGVGITGAEILQLQEALNAFQKVCKLDRQSLPHFRRAANNLRLSKNATWLKKFEVGIETCN